MEKEIDSICKDTVITHISFGYTIHLSQYDLPHSYVIPVISLSYIKQVSHDCLFVIALPLIAGKP